MSNSNIIRLLIADSDPTLRKALVLFFDLEDDIEVVGQAADHDEVHALHLKHQPDVILVSVALQNAKLISLVRTLCKERPNIKIVVLASELNGASIAQEFLQVGASKYVEKGIFASDLLRAIRQVYHQNPT